MDKNKKKFVKYGILILCLIFCWYECGPDPENKRKFKKTLGIGLTPDVKNIQYCGDFIGIDYSIYLAFNCDSSTIARIIKENRLEFAGKTEIGHSCYCDWWDQEKISTIVPYKKRTRDDTHRFLWYDKENKKAYYTEFST